MGCNGPFLAMHGIPFQQSIEQSPLQFYSIFDTPEFIVAGGITGCYGHCMTWQAA